MPTTKKPIRKSISMPPAVAKRVKTLARAQRTSESRVLVALIETGLAAKDDERQQFHDLVDRLPQTKSKAEQKRIKEELARLTFGD